MTLFKDMPAASIQGWLKWCDCHDWSADYHHAYYEELSGEVITCEVSTDGFQTFIKLARHSSPVELKTWAGY